MTQEYRKLQFFLDISTDIFLELDAAGRIGYYNSKAWAVFESKDLSQKLLWDFMDLKNSELISLHLQECLQTNLNQHFSIIFKTREYNIFMYPFADKATICLEDITERRQISTVLRHTSERLEFAERTARLGYWELDLQVKKIFWSAEMYRIFGIDAKSVSMKRNIIREQILPEDLPIYKNKLKDLIKKGNPVEGQLRIRRKDGNISHCQFKASLIFDDRGERIAGTFQDLTHLVEVQLALEKSRERADELNRAKSYFLAQASHDLRQPMQALNIFIATLRDEKLEPPQTKLVEKIAASADNLKVLLDNFLDISKLDSGGVEYQPHNFNIKLLVERLGHEFVEIALSRNLDFYYTSSSAMLHNDPVLIERILRNLLSNSFKYTHSKILMAARLQKSTIRIFVMDNGAGIASSDLPKIFDEFYQSSKIKDNRKNGAGLGLSIVKKIADIIGTKVDVISTPHRSTCFSFSLPTINSGH